MATVSDFIFLGSKITVDGDCSHEIKGCLLLGRKALTNLDSILKAETSLCGEQSELGLNKTSLGCKLALFFTFFLFFLEGTS